MCASSRTLLAQEGVALEKGSLSDSEVPTILLAWPVAPVAGAGGGGGERGAPVPHLACTVRHRPQKRVYAGRKGEEVRAGSGVDRLDCWGPALLLPPLLKVGGGGVLCAGMVPGCDPFLQEERYSHHGRLNSEPRWLTANWC